ncbi:MAG: amphi-Trp domain-containing protein [Candidatus Electrothrix sp. AW2]|jgi:amphi-Trp domain-containing protein|nr:amphi-Trp domain-containing protein [Candidatus Electrothrix sp. AX1]MCI5127349.1 amphi-Trp domain-containing protein [Candidatus Electrothrix gigas]MCI5135112.1 amphi-Trp domain-containing protein [Candidatus Electrothrix gigas]MCI5180609.1 amphi-Trp domain-containing protein [Candidatus Electrothrix gigas]MCI5183259.1 amphi-Trp domain-containing protein [Candidatus Electrothrix gigas]
MGRETVLFKTEEKMTRQEAAELLRNVAKKLETGKVILQQGTKEVKIKIPERVELEVKAEKEVGKRRTKKKLELEIEWLVGASANKHKPLTLG